MTCPSIIALAVTMAAMPDAPQQKRATISDVAPMQSNPVPAQSDHGQMSTRTRGIWLWLTLVVACIIVSVGGHALVVWLEGAFGLKGPDVRTMLTGWVYIGLLLVYIVLLALPFVPGAEIGILLLMVFGAEAALPVYGATVTALLISFLVGGLVALPRLVDGLRKVGLSRAAKLIQSGTLPAVPTTDASSRSGRANALLNRILQHRCIALGVLFNTPGNSLLGGGGGIALAVGASRLLTFPQFLLTTLIAVAPVPVAILIASVFTAN